MAAQPAQELAEPRDRTSYNAFGRRLRFGDTRRRRESLGKIIRYHFENHPFCLGRRLVRPGSVSRHLRDINTRATSPRMGCNLSRMCILASFITKLSAGLGVNEETRVPLPSGARLHTSEGADLGLTGSAG